MKTEIARMQQLAGIILEEDNKILITRRSPEERQKNYVIASNKKVQQYIKDGNKGDLDLSNTPISSLPAGLVVGRNFYLGYTQITSLPAGLKVGGDLSLNNTQIISLPSGLVVGRDLDLIDTPITSLPAGLKVEGDLFISFTPLSKEYTKEQIRKMCPGVKGHIFI